MKSRRTVGTADSTEAKSETRYTGTIPGNSSRRDESWFVAPLLVIVAVVCCAGPILVAALAATGAGAWLAWRGFIIGAAVLFGLALLLASLVRARLIRP
jgi:hypothetical protein